MSADSHRRLLRAAGFGRLMVHVPAQYTKIIYAYMGFAGFSIFFILTGVIVLRLMEKAGLAMDAFSFSTFSGTLR